MRPFPLLVLLFAGLPLLDLFLVVQLSRFVGFWETVLLIILSGIAGAWLAKQQGAFVWRSIQRDLAEGRVPDQGLLDGIIVLFAGGMLAAPGFLTDFLGLLLLLPPVRLPIKRLARRYMERAIVRTFPGELYTNRSTGPYPTDVDG
jgi:UPF0716 protein FxsA